MNKTLTTLIIAVTVEMLNAFAAPHCRVISLGGSEGWAALARTDALAHVKGRFGYDALKLSTDSRAHTRSADLLADFEGERLADIAGDYSVSSNALTTHEGAAVGQRAALARGNGGLSLKGREGALFGQEGPAGSFTIEVWLNPSIVENGEIFFSWRSSRSVAGYPVYQRITASFFSNKVEWVFTNIFNGYVRNNGEVLLRSNKTIIPGTWAHHSISFNRDTGLLEYRINGRSEDLAYLTESGHEGGEIYEAVLGTVANIEVGSQYTGLVDDFRILRTAESETALALRADTYDLAGGRFESVPFETGEGTATAVRLDALMQRPPETEIELFVRGGDNIYNWTESYPEWVSVVSGEEIEGVTGRYLQVAGNLLPDGSGSESPVLTGLKLYFEEVPPPSAPSGVEATPADGGVRLSWALPTDDDVGGYYVYYGARPGEYLGSDAGEGQSPLDVGNVTSLDLTNLTNGRIYYFSVAAYSKRSKEIVGPLSQEVYARPSARRVPSREKPGAP